MTEEVVTEQTQDQIDQQEQSDFDKGYGKAPEQSAPEQKAEDKTDDTATQGETREVKAEEPGEAAPLIGGLTEEQWNAQIAKAIGPVREALAAENRKNFGQIGELNKAIKELREGLAAGKPSRKITADLLKRVNEELPGLGEALASDLSEILGAAEEKKDDAQASGQAFNEEKYFAEKVAPAIAKATADADRKAQAGLLEYIHPDYAQVVNSEPFKAWLATKTPQEQQAMLGAERAIEAAKAVSDFKAWAEKSKKTKETQQKRISAAVTPRGVPGDGPVSKDDEEAGFNEGWKKASRSYA